MFGSMMLGRNVALTLGLPSIAVTALIFGALMIHGIAPGPFLIGEQPQLFRGVVVSMYIGNVLLLILAPPMARVHSISNDVVDMGMPLFFGLLGYLMRNPSFEPGPLVPAFVLCPILGTAFRRSLTISGGRPRHFRFAPDCAIVPHRLGAAGGDADRREDARDGDCPRPAGAGPAFTLHTRNNVHAC